jgi:hypothetical protein
MRFYRFVNTESALAYKVKFSRSMKKAGKGSFTKVFAGKRGVFSHAPEGTTIET